MIGWDEIESAVRECDACRLCDERRSAVPGEGRRDADIMLIGEGPGEQEDLSGGRLWGRRDNCSTKC